jgi:hypothetical protein
MDADPPGRIVPAVLLVATGMLSVLAANAGIGVSLWWALSLSLPMPDAVRSALFVWWCVHPLAQLALALPVGFGAGRIRAPLGAGAALGAAVTVPLYVHAVRWWLSLHSHGRSLEPTLEDRLFELYTDW